MTTISTLSGCLREHPAPTPAQLAEIEELEASARCNIQSAADSFDRCDTDGFLSQWADGITADLKRHQADLLRDGGYAQFPVLCDADGNVVADRIYTFTNQFADWTTVERWKLPAELEAKHSRRWVPVAGYSGKSRVQKQIGLHEESRWFPAYAKITGSGTGLSGCASAYVGVFRADTNQQ
jgi:hypothetical protein